MASYVTLCPNCHIRYFTHIWGCRLYFGMQNWKRLYLLFLSQSASWVGVQVILVISPNVIYSPKSNHNSQHSKSLPGNTSQLGRLGMYYSKLPAPCFWPASWYYEQPWKIITGILIWSTLMGQFPLYTLYDPCLSLYTMKTQVSIFLPIDSTHAPAILKCKRGWNG